MSAQSQPLSIEDLFGEYSDKLQLQWVAGQGGKNREILPETMSDESHAEVASKLNLTDEIALAALVPTGRSFVGYLNLIHPHQIQILGNTELSYIETLRDTTRDDAIRTLKQVADFFRRTEPHSPISYSLDQAVRWGRMSLPDLLGELIDDDTTRAGLFRLAGIPTPGQDE